MIHKNKSFSNNIIYIYVINYMLLPVIVNDIYTCDNEL